MASDVNALRDRLLADAIATGLRGRDGFTVATTLLALPELKQHLRERAQMYRQDISATEAEAETGAEQALQMWQQLMPQGRVWRTVTTLTYAATALLQVRGGEVVLQVRREEPGREILQWRYVSLALPQEILVAAVDPDGVSATGRVRVLDRSIAPDSPVAQQHVHHAAMISFEEVWSSLRLRALLAPGALVASLRDLRAFCPHLHRGPCDAGRGTTAKASRSVTDRAKHMAAWGDVIRQAFIARRILERHAGHSRMLTNCSEGDCAQVTRGVLWRFTTGRTPIQSRGVTAYPWPDELVGLARRHRDAITPSLLKRSHRERTDFMAKQAANERALLRRAIMYVRPDERESSDPLFERLFLQYLRVKVAIFGLLVHQPGEHGLRKFLEHFSQIKVYAPEAEFLRPRRPVEPGLQVDATEYRVAPDAWFRARRRPENVIEEHRGEAGTGAEAAWVIHFKRAAPGKTLPLHGTDVRRMESDADQIVRSLSVRPSDLQRLRAIDICGVEDAQPSWVSAPTLRRVRRQSSRVAALSPRLHLEPLRLSIHTGEDFLWLTSGTRAIAEPFHWRLIERGDRIGHGIAITLEPNDWWERWNGRVLFVKRIDRLMDLAFLAEYAHTRTNDESEWLRIGIEVLVRDLGFKHGPGRSDVDIVSTARKFWRCLGSRVSRRLMSTSVPPIGDERLHESWIYAYLWSRSTQDRAAEVLHLKVADDYHRGVMRHREGSVRVERDLLVKARKRLIREVARWQVCIESNPTSNLVVGSLDAMAAQDFLQRRPTEVCGEGDETLTWTISTDDPITFSTTLADEYAYAWAGMVLREKNPYDPAYARALLDEAAATSMRTRFTIPADENERGDNQRGHRRKRRG